MRALAYMLEKFTLFSVALREKEFFDSSVCVVTNFVLENCGSIRGMGLSSRSDRLLGPHSLHCKGTLPEDIYRVVKRLEL
jgi:hypothetical protein